jgi:uncharacterized protein (TIGR03067 family)
MHRTLGLLGLVLGSCLAASAAAPPDDRVKQEEEKLAGTWRVVSVEIGGMNVPPREFRDLRITYKDGKFTARRGQEPAREGTYKLDPMKRPKTMDIIHKSEAERGQTQLAIYALSGNTLKICSCVSGKERPADFVTRDQPEYTLMVLKREP